MAKAINAQEVQIKARKTKLNKKSVEDLVNIILRKDAVERKNNETIVSLKNEVNESKIIIDGLKADMKGMEYLNDNISSDILDLQISNKILKVTTGVAIAISLICIFIVCI